MHTPTNLFKQAIAQRQAQIGLWLGLADAYSAELLASTGYDWLLVDGGPAPHDLRSILHQLQAIASATSALPAGAPAPHPIARVPIGEQTLIKQYLDIGVQTLLVPMVDTAEQAQALVRATRYAPAGVRGIGPTLPPPPPPPHPTPPPPAAPRCSTGPAHLSASRAHPGHPEPPSVQAAIQDGIGRILRAGKAPGILVTSEPQAHQWLAAGALFVAVGVDAQLLVNAARKLLAGFRAVPAGGQAPRAAGS